MPGKPIAPALGVAYSFPDVCETILPFVGKIQLPFSNVAQLMQLEPGSVSDEPGNQLLIGPAGLPAVLEKAKANTSTGDEVGFLGGIVTGDTNGECEVQHASRTVLYGSEGKGLVRFMDVTTQNVKDGQPNAAGNILAAFPTVIVGE